MAIATKFGMDIAWGKAHLFLNFYHKIKKMEILQI